MISIIADVHVHNHRLFGESFQGGMNKRCQMVLSSLKTALALAPGRIYVAGDLFHVSDPSSVILGAVAQIFKESKREIVLMYGNHDLSVLHNGRLLGALTPLSAIDNVLVLDSQEAIERHLAETGVYAQSYFPEQTLPDVKADVVLGHYGISDSSTPEFLKGFAVEKILALKIKNQVKLWAAGDWHERKSFLSDIWQVGALVPTGFDNLGMQYGTVLTFDKTAEVIEIPGPRFLKELSELREADKVTGNRLFFRTEDPLEMGNARHYAEEVHQAIKKKTDLRFQLSDVRTVQATLSEYIKKYAQAKKIEGEELEDLCFKLMR